MNRQEIVLGRVECYEASPKVWSFKKVDDIVHGMNLRLSNMVGGFPFECQDTVWKDSERLYLCGEFSNNTEEHRQIQEKLCSAKSGYAAKRWVKTPNKRAVREDFATFRLDWMLYCVWQKCLGNKDFRKLLTSIPEEVTLVENTTTDNQGTADIWGCRNKALVAERKRLTEEITRQNAHLGKKELERLVNIETNKVDSIGQWQGQNNIGKILMICRNALLAGAAPMVDYYLLKRAEIYILGKKALFP